VARSSRRTGTGIGLAVVYLGAVVALCVMLGRSADSLAVTLVVVAALLGVHAAAALAASDHPGWAFAVATASVLGLAAAGTISAYAGRWWWSAAFALAAFWLFAMAAGTLTDAGWFRAGSAGLGGFALVWAVVGPLWLYGLTPEEARDLVADVAADWWWLAAVAGIAVVVPVAVVAMRDRGRRREPGSTYGYPAPSRPSRQPTKTRSPSTSRPYRWHRHRRAGPWWVWVLTILGIAAGVFAVVEHTNPWPLVWTGVLLLPVIVYWVVTGLADRRGRPGEAVAKLVLAGLATAGLAFVAVNVIGGVRACTTEQVPGGNLARCDLSQADLAGLDLTQADLTGATLRGADLTGANLRGATLLGTDLREADLTDTLLERAVLGRTDLTGATGLSDATLAVVLGTDETGLRWALSSAAIRLEGRDAVLAAAGTVRTGGTIAPAPPGGAAVPGFHPIAAVNASGQPGDWSSGPGRQGWEPMAVRFTDLVACVGEEQEEPVEECAYIGGSPITRYVFWRDVRVLAADTGAEIWAGRIEGAYPEQCPARAPAQLTRIDGGPADFTAAVPILEPLVAAPTES